MPRDASMPRDAEIGENGEHEAIPPVDASSDARSEAEGGASLGGPCRTLNDCASGLVCCYPCGAVGCTNQCMVPCDAGGAPCIGGCWLYP
jgi:hypothetical protein